uniref:Uncharacterized protein n=1 Tax=Avena sativa TaxID=4498 RepID=A0ACD5TB92_AVESA
MLRLRRSIVYKLFSHPISSRQTSRGHAPSEAPLPPLAGAGAMLRLRGCIVSHPSTSPISHLHRLLSAKAPPVSPNPPISPSQGFAVEDYLVHTCGLTRAQALKASTQLSHLKSSSKPDAVLAFLSGHGFSSADVATTVANYPRLLCAGVERTLAPRVAGLTGLGLSNPDIARLISLVGGHFRLKSIVPRLQFYLSLFGSSANLLRVLDSNSYLVGFDLEKVVKPNVAFLRQCGLGPCDITKVCIRVPRMLSTKHELVQAMVARAEGLGVPRGSRMFKIALQAVAFMSEEKLTAKVDYLKKTFRWSDAQLSFALTRAPFLLRRSKDMLQRRSEFLISEVGLEPAYIAHYPIMLYYSMEARLIPRYYVLKFLKENGFLDQDWRFYTVLTKTQDGFVKKYICPYKDVAPHLAEDYAAACRGEIPANFRFA